MAGSGIKMEVRIEDKDLRRAFARLRGVMRDTAPLMRVIGIGLTANVQGRLSSGYFAAQWPALNPLYKAGKRNKNMMVESGMLRASLTSKPGCGYVFVGTNRIYAAIQQFGGEIRAKKAGRLRFKMGNSYFAKKSVKIPARPQRYFTVSECA